MSLLMMLYSALALQLLGVLLLLAVWLTQLALLSHVDRQVRGQEALLRHLRNWDGEL